jgi:hypothetical protein
MIYHSDDETDFIRSKDPTIKSIISYDKVQGFFMSISLSPCLWGGRQPIKHGAGKKHCK